MDSLNNFVFGVTDYVVFIIMLAISTSIGLYFGLFAKTKNTTDEYLVGGKQMKILPVAVSIIASQLSPLSVLSVPAENYSYGLGYILVELSLLICIPALCYITIPVFYDNNITNCYKYLELRFNKRTMQLVTATFVLNSFLILPVILFVPSLAFSQVSGINVHLINSGVCAVCVLYTMLGGIKAVVWADVAQMGITLTFAVVVGVLGTYKLGGLSQVYQRASEGGRLNFNFSLDPRVRITVWNSLIGGSITFTAYLGLTQCCIQRIISLPSLKHARIALFLASIGFSVILTLMCFNGIVMYAHYHGCDPMLTGLVTKADQLMPFFVQDVMGHFNGLPGVFISCVFSTGFSPMAGILNALAGVVYFDFIKPFIRHTDAKGNAIMKISIVALGVYSVFGGYVVQKFDSIIQLIVTVAGISYGAIVGVFTVGMLVPRVNSKSAIISMSLSIITLLWILVNTNIKFQEGIMNYPPLPTTIDQCHEYSFHNNTSSEKSTTINKIPTTNFPTDSPLLNITAISSSREFSITEISFYWYTLTGLLIFWVTAIPLSLVLKPEKDEALNPKLFTPIVRKFLKKNEVPMEETPLRIKQYR